MDVNTFKKCGQCYLYSEKCKIPNCKNSQFSECIAKLDEIYRYSFEKAINLSFCCPLINVFHMPNIPPSIKINSLSYKLSVYMRIILGVEKLMKIPIHLLYYKSCQLVVLQAALHWPLLDDFVRKYVQENRLTTKYNLSCTVVMEFFDSFYKLAIKCNDLQLDQTEIQLLHVMLVTKNEDGSSSSASSCDVHTVLAQYENRKYGISGQRRSSKVTKIFFKINSLVNETGVSRLTAPLNSEFGEFPIQQYDMEILTSILYFNEC